MGWSHRREPGLLREALLALLVLSLTFLNFNAPAFAAVETGSQPTATVVASFCGDHSLPGDVAHFACHACRPTLADLPPPPTSVVRIDLRVGEVAYPHVVAGPAAEPPTGLSQPRGPPEVV